MLGWIKRNWFVLGIVAALTAGLLLSEVGAALNPSGLTTTLVLLCLFLLIGVTLPSENIVRGLMSYRLHLWVQLFIFVLAPVYFYFTSALLRPYVDTGLLVFNATLANMAGVLLSPVLLSLFLSTTGQGLPREEILNVLVSLCLKMILPVLVGQGIRALARDWATERRKVLSSVSSVLILSVVFFAAAKSANHPALNRGFAYLIVPIVYLAISHILLVALLGVAILPLLFYHPFQLLVAGVIKGSRLVKR